MTVDLGIGAWISHIASKFNSHLYPPLSTMKLMNYQRRQLWAWAQRARRIELIKELIKRNSSQNDVCEFLVRVWRWKMSTGDLRNNSRVLLQMLRQLKYPAASQIDSLALSQGLPHAFLPLLHWLLSRFHTTALQDTKFIGIPSLLFSLVLFYTFLYSLVLFYLYSHHFPL